MRNPGEAPVALPIYEPFIAFSVTAAAGGKAVTVHRPRLDIGVNPATLRLPPAAVVTIHSPVRLRIAEGAQPGTDGLVWTIAHSRGDLSLHVELDLPPPFADPCPLLFD